MLGVRRRNEDPVGGRPGAAPLEGIVSLKGDWAELRAFRDRVAALEHAAVDIATTSAPAVLAIANATYSGNATANVSDTKITIEAAPTVRRGRWMPETTVVPPNWTVALDASADKVLGAAGAKRKV